MNTNATVLTQDLQRRAVAIADECMAEQIRCEAIPSDDSFCRYLLANANQGEVRTLEEADPAIVEAFEYLRDRGLAVLVTEADGFQVIELREAA